jgi:hypothetical protein
VSDPISDMSGMAASGAAAIAIAEAADEQLQASGPHQQGHCHNCQAQLAGLYCHACGQKTGHLHRPIWELLHDFLHSILHWDGRIWVTLRAMLLTPAKHTNDWINGRQMRYVPPIRLFVFISLLLIILLKFSDVVLWQLKKIQPSASETTQAYEAQDRKLKCLLDSVSPNAPDMGKTCNQFATTSSSHYSGQFLSLEDKNTGLHENLVNVDDVIVEGGADVEQARGVLQKLNEMMKKPKEFNAAISNSLSKYLLLAVPLHALLLKLFYIRRKRFLMEHIILSLQSHTILFLLLLIAVLLAWISRGTINGDALIAALFIIYAVHLFVTMKRFYGQGIIRTSLKYLMIGGCYFLLMLSVGSFMLVRSMGGLAEGKTGMKIDLSN